MLTLNFSPFPQLETDRLVLRQLSEQDRSVIFFLRSDETVLQYLGREPIQSESEAVAFIQTINKNVDTNTSILWGIALRSQPEELIGTICFWNMQPENHRSETGYVLHPSHWGKGYMLEAMKAILSFGFDTLKLHSVEARLSPDNSASKKLLEKAGFKKEGYFREDYFFRDQYLDTLVYSLLVTDWKSSEHAIEGSK